MDVQNDGRLILGEHNYEVVTQCNSQSVKVAADDGEEWRIDPWVEDIELTWIIWVYARKPLASLRWDAREYQWHNPSIDKIESFLKYYVRRWSMFSSINQKDHVVVSYWMSKLW